MFYECVKQGRLRDPGVVDSWNSMTFPCLANYERKRDCLVGEEGKPKDGCIALNGVELGSINLDGAERLPPKGF